MKQATSYPNFSSAEASRKEIKSHIETLLVHIYNHESEKLAQHQSSIFPVIEELDSSFTPATVHRWVKEGIESCVDLVRQDIVKSIKE